MRPPAAPATIEGSTRAWEIVDGTVGVEADEAEAADDPQPTADRQWLIQCKRERAIGPKKLADYMGDLPAAVDPPLHGVIFAAACDFSIKARDEFRRIAREKGLSEAYLWGRGEIEDMLYQPKNDHLLFAYFGVSLSRSDLEGAGQDIGVARERVLVDRQAGAGGDLVLGDDDFRILPRQHDRLAACRDGAAQDRRHDNRRLFRPERCRKQQEQSCQPDLLQDAVSSPLMNHVPGLPQPRFTR
ncbi:MAG: hypothetical protein IPK59_16465 [Rhodospirillaceae bacterium]|nr:hypothetical protein [Rhodospirillaceae bacterium]